MRQGMKRSSGRSFTTRETIALGRPNIRHVLEGRNAVEPTMSGASAGNQRRLASALERESTRRSLRNLLRCEPFSMLSKESL